MLRVTIEIVPHGREVLRTTLAIFHITNIGRPGKSEFEDARSYKVHEVHSEGVELRAVVVHRRSAGFFPLVVRALHMALRRRER